jgi:hypothetical protein
MSTYSGISVVNHTRHNTAQGSVLVPDDKQAPPTCVETHVGPWGWQWRGGMHDIVSASPSSRPITIKALMDDIEEVGALERNCVSRIADERSI